MPGDIFVRGNQFLDVVFRFPCAQRILMVTDESLNFGAGFFGLSEFVQIIRNAGHTVVTAHRNGTSPGSGVGLSIAGNFNFFGAATAVTVANYDQIWLFGFSGAALQANEQTRIAQFMQAGGGVFATGDHGSLGAGMGANLPRVRAMRNWATIPMSSPQRLDTVIDPGVDGIKQFDDQADAIPQRMFPVFFSNGGDDFVASTWAVHPILRHPSGAVDFLPDHPHESECLEPTPVAGNFAGVEEWPAPTSGGARIAAQVVAVSVSAGRFIVSGAPTASQTKPPVKPRSFGAISAYDGDAAGVGRIVCDATWHHFVNINLNGAGAAADSNGTARLGLNSAPGAPTPEYLKIQRYYTNTARWLAPSGRRHCWPFVLAAVARFDPEMLEFRLPHPHPCPWDPLIAIGRLAEEVLIKHLGPGALVDAVDAMLATVGRESALGALLDSSRLRADGKRERARSLLPLVDMRRAALGALVNALADALPQDVDRLASLAKKHDRIALDAISSACREAEQAIAEHLDAALRVTTAQLRSLRAGPKEATAARTVKATTVANAGKPAKTVEPSAAKKPR